MDGLLEAICVLEFLVAVGSHSLLHLILNYLRWLVLSCSVLIRRRSLIHIRNHDLLGACIDVMGTTSTHGHVELLVLLRRRHRLHLLSAALLNFLLLLR